MCVDVENIFFLVSINLVLLTNISKEEIEVIVNLTKEENEIMVYLNGLVTHHLLLALLQQFALCGLVNAVAANWLEYPRQLLLK